MGKPTPYLESISNICVAGKEADSSPINVCMDFLINPSLSSSSFCNKKVLLLTVICVVPIVPLVIEVVLNFVLETLVSSPSSVTNTSKSSTSKV